MCVYRYLNQIVRKIGLQNDTSFNSVSKTKNKKKHMKRLNFITRFKTEILLPFTGYKKMLGKMHV